MINFSLLVKIICFKEQDKNHIITEYDFQSYKKISNEFLLCIV